MTRPQYETEEDRGRQRDVALYAVSCWAHLGISQAVMLPRMSALDCCFSNDVDVKAYAEIKCREWIFGEGEGYRISKRKLISAQTTRLMFHVQVLLIVKFADQTVVLDFHRQLPSGYIKNGRSDRDDPQDIEEMAVYDWDGFHKLAPPTML